MQRSSCSGLGCFPRIQNRQISTIVNVEITVKVFTLGEDSCPAASLLEFKWWLIAGIENCRLGVYQPGQAPTDTARKRGRLATARKTATLVAALSSHLRDDAAS